MSDTFQEQFLPEKLAKGMTHYHDHYQDQQRDLRIVLNIAIERRRYIQAILDTGTPWCILNPLFFELLGIPLPVQEAPHERLLIRGTVYTGWLLPMSIELLADKGKNMEVEATTFVPILSSEEAWVHPNFLGLDGFLSRIRFAMDPTENAFYFGSI